MPNRYSFKFCAVFTLPPSHSFLLTIYSSLYILSSKSFLHHLFLSYFQERLLQLYLFFIHKKTFSNTLISLTISSASSVPEDKAGNDLFQPLFIFGLLLHLSKNIFVKEGVYFVYRYQTKSVMSSDASRS